MLTAWILALSLLVRAGGSRLRPQHLGGGIRERTPDAFAAEFEEPSRALFRYRAAMAGLMQVKPGMKVGEVGAGSGYLARYIAEKVGADGHVVRQRARAEDGRLHERARGQGGPQELHGDQGTADVDRIRGRIARRDGGCLRLQLLRPPRGDAEVDARVAQTERPPA